MTARPHIHSVQNYRCRQQLWGK